MRAWRFSFGALMVSAVVGGAMAPVSVAGTLTQVLAWVALVGLAVLVGGQVFGLALFTNLSRDHLDYHGSMDAYLASKMRLFREHLAPGATAVVNADDARPAPEIRASTR